MAWRHGGGHKDGPGKVHAHSQGETQLVWPRGARVHSRQNGRGYLWAAVASGPLTAVEYWLWFEYGAIINILLCASCERTQIHARVLVFCCVLRATCYGGAAHPVAPCGHEDVVVEAHAEAAAGDAAAIPCVLRAMRQLQRALQEDAPELTHSGHEASLQGCARPLHERRRSRRP